MIHIAVVDDDAEERARVREYLDGMTARSGTEFSVREFRTAAAFSERTYPSTTSCSWT